MVSSDTVSKIGMTMAYYGAFGSVGSGIGFLVSKGRSQEIGIGAVLLALGLAYAIKRAFQIKFVGPSGD